MGTGPFRRYIWIPVLAAGIAVSISGYTWLNNQETQSVRLEMAHRSNAKLEAIHAILKQHLDISLTITAFLKGEMMSREYVEEDEVQSFSIAMLDTHPEELVTIAIIPPKGAGEAQVTSQSGAGQLDPPLDRQHLNSLTPGVPATQALQNKEQRWLIRRITAIKNRKGTGYVISDWSLAAMIAIAIADTHEAGLDIETGLIRNGQFVQIYTYWSPLRKTGDKSQEKITWQGNFSLHGMEFEVRTRALPNVLLQLTSTNPKWTLLLGLVLSLLLAYLVYNRSRYGERMLREVERQTQALEEREYQHKEAQHIAHLGHWNLDLVKNELVWSDEVFRIFSTDQEEFDVSYEAFLDIVHPDDRSFVDHAYTESLQSKTPYNIEHRLLMKDGSIKWVNERCVTHYDKDGAPLRSAGTVLDITERKKAEEKLNWLSYYDELTGLPNRRLFADRTDQAIAAARREKSSAAVLFIDLDRFKFINDTMGHACGDQVLKNIAARLEKSLRASDTAARMGGDEFAVLLPGADAKMAMRVAYKLRSALQQPCLIGEQELSLDASIGMAIFPQDGEDREAILKHADTAMYHAKKDQTHIHYFSSDMEEKAYRHLHMGQELAKAVDKKQLTLHYQSQHRLDHGSVIGVEALVRWKHPELGMVSPAEFIPLAEETGQIRAITYWVLAEAGRQAAAWEKAGIRPGRISVNLSAVQLMQKGLAEEIIEQISKTGAELEWLEIEITETAAMREPETGIAIMRKLVEAGISIAIDDFGTGYSSLAYLKRLPAECLKIDIAFIRELPDAAEDAVIVRSIIAMAHALGMQVIAEGVETETQLEFLRNEGCDAVQGYYFSKPLPADEITMYIKQNPSR